MPQQTPDTRPPTLLILAAVAGCVDAIGFIEMGGWFASFMSGNITRAGLDAADRLWSSAAFALGLVLLFVGGVAAGSLIAQRTSRWRVPLVLGVAALLIAVAAFGDGYQFATFERPSLPPLVLAMGLINMAFPGAPGVTYVTGALIRIGEGLGGGGPARAGMGFDLALVISLCSGVAASAVLYSAYGAALLWVPVTALLLAALGHFGDRGPRRPPIR